MSTLQFLHLILQIRFLFIYFLIFEKAIIGTLPAIRIWLFALLCLICPVLVKPLLQVERKFIPWKSIKLGNFLAYPSVAEAVAFT